LNNNILFVRSLLIGLVLIASAAGVLRGVGLLRYLILPARVPTGSSYVIPSTQDSGQDSLRQISEQFRKRNIFVLPTVAVTEIPKGIDHQVQGLSLIGLVSTGAAEAIVKDASTGNTYFVKPGDRIREMSVAEVQNNYIILEWKNEKKKLYIT